jgi:membrane-bound lytic murein transglycosylase A
LPESRIIRRAEHWRRCALAPGLARVLALVLAPGLAVAWLAGCQTLGPPGPSAPPPPPHIPAQVPAPAAVPAAPSPEPLPFSGPLPIPWSDASVSTLQVRYALDNADALTRIDDADWLAGWPAWLASCHALTSIHHPHRQAWQRPCAEALALNPNRGAQVRAFFAAHMDPYRVLAVDGPQQTERDTGLITGYYEPEIEGRRERGGPYVIPLYRLPAVVPTAARADLEASGQMRGQELLWVRDPIEAFFLEVQGSGRIHLGQGTWIRLAYAGSNGQAYRSIGRWLIDQGELPAEHVSMQSISDWTHTHPQRVRELLDQNPRMVFFREQVLAREDAGPVGTLGVALTPGFSVAVDPKYLPLGAPLLLSIASAAGAAAAGERLPDDLLPARLALAQDTGGAIRGPLRVDWYWGQGSGAGEIAGRQRAMGTIRLLVPRGFAPESLL